MEAWFWFKVLKVGLTKKLGFDDEVMSWKRNLKIDELARIMVLWIARKQQGCNGMS